MMDFCLDINNQNEQKSNQCYDELHSFFVAMNELWFK